jgi:hypothetical protein
MMTTDAWCSKYAGAESTCVRWEVMVQKVHRVRGDGVHAHKTTKHRSNNDRSHYTTHLILWVRVGPPFKDNVIPYV